MYCMGDDMEWDFEVLLHILKDFVTLLGAKIQSPLGSLFRYGGLIVSPFMGA